jgi:hypothetical protein
VDIDLLNQQIPVSFFPAHGRWKADSFTALKQLVEHVNNLGILLETLQDLKYAARLEALEETHRRRIANIDSLLGLDDASTLDANNIGYLLKAVLPLSTTFVIEAVTAA